MTKGKEFKEKLKKKLKKLSRECFHYTRMPLQDRINELSKLKKENRELEGRLQNIGNHILVLEQMPDVAEYLLTRDKLAMALMETIKKTGAISYFELNKILGDKYNQLIPAYIPRLKTSQLIKISPHLKNPIDEIIKLTERGKTVKYIPSK